MKPAGVTSVDFNQAPVLDYKSGAPHDPDPDAERACSPSACSPSAESIQSSRTPFGRKSYEATSPALVGSTIDALRCS